MRCPDCRKFVSFDEPEIEVSDESIQDNATVYANVRVVLPCMECSTELKEANLEAQAEIVHVCDEDTVSEERVDQEPEFEIQSVEADPHERSAAQDRTGKPIKQARYMRTFRGAALTFEIKCLRCDEEFSVETTVEEQASFFQELV